MKSILNAEFVSFFDGMVETILLASGANAPPVITSNGGGAAAAISVAENTTAVTTLTATDPDAEAVLGYAIAGGADATLFTINATTGALAFFSGRNFEVRTDAGGNNVYDVLVQVSDGTLTDSQSLAVTVTNSALGVTINGTAGSDVISLTETVAGQAFATDENDLLQGLGGNDTLNGGLGLGTIVGGIGNGSCRAGGGNLKVA